MSPRQTIAHYRITAKLGQGGMGEVWRATDTKLGRDVAIKILPDAFAEDAGRMARFEREAQVLASLNHPNIAQIYGVEERALVMELVEGETLQCPLPIDTAQQYARQIADALEAAHEKGVVHRDLKPANVMITPAGVVKVLDFGLARITEGNTASDPAVSPTLTISPSRTGVIMGTAAYMAPEQARGKTVDKRADIWAFGCVLYEMLTGRPAFEGETTSDILAAVIKEEPDLEQGVPAHLRPIITKCLRKDPRLRWRDIGDVRMALEEPPPAAVIEAVRRRSLLPWVLLAAVSIIAIGLGLALWRASRPIEKPLLTLSVDLGPDAVAGRDTTVALSDDGTRMVFPVRTPGGKQALAIRFLNQPNATVLAGTEDGINAFFSRDGQWVGFFAGGKLKKISVQGGAPITLCNAPAGRGGSWGEDGYIIAALGTFSGLSRIPERGGSPEPLTKPAATGETHRWPQIVPAGQAVLFTASPKRTDFENATIEALSLKTGQRKTLERSAFFGRYLPSGHLVFLRQETLFAVPFNAARLEVAGQATPVLEQVSASTFGGGQFDFSQHGTFVYLYLPGQQSHNLWRIVSVGSAGTIQPLISTPGFYFGPRLSPDGKQMSVSTGTANGPGDIWIYDLERETATKITFTGGNGSAVWIGDGKHIAYLSSRGGTYGIKWMRADGSGEPTVLLESKNYVYPSSCSSDGKRLAYVEVVGPAQFDAWTLPLDTSDPDHPKTGRPELLLRTGARTMTPMFSPDGRWIAYASDESGTSEIYVRPFTGSSTAGGKWQISAGGGSQPMWSRAGRQLLYATFPDFRIMAIDYAGEGNAFRPGEPRLWADQPFPNSAGVIRAFDLAPDGKRIVMIAPAADTDKPKGNLHVTFLLNFFDELQRRLQPRR